MQSNKFICHLIPMEIPNKMNKIKCFIINNEKKFNTKVLKMHDFSVFSSEVFFAKIFKSIFKCILGIGFQSITITNK